MKKTVCVDLDGTIAQYDGWKGVDHFGDPLPGAKEFLVKLRETYEVVIYTTRCNEEMNKPEKAHLLEGRVRAWLEKHGLPYDSIYVGQGKPIAVAYVDDRSVMVRENAEWTESYINIIMRFVNALAEKKAITGEEK